MTTLSIAPLIWFDTGTILTIRKHWRVSHVERYTFERTFDAELVRQIVTHPQIYRAELLAEGYPDREQWQPPPTDDCWCVVARKGAAIIGLYLLEPAPSGIWPAHIAMLPEGWGVGSAEVCRAAIRWLAAHSDCKRLTCRVADFNRSALAFVRRVGFEVTGRLEGSITQHGKPHSHYLFEISV